MTARYRTLGRAARTTECSSSSGQFTIMQDSDFFSTDWFYTGPDLWPVTFGTTTLNDSYSTDAEDDHLEWAWDLVKD